MNYPSEAEARVALHGVEGAQQRVIDQIGMPWWYWWGLALAWVGFGVCSDLASPWWVTLPLVLAFGAVHSYVSSRLLAGRQRTSGVRVRADVAGRRAPLLVFGSLVALVGVTIVAALLVDADGAEHPGTIASVFVAALILLGGPRVMATIRSEASRRATA
jgi:hypothetical protein